MKRATIAAIALVACAKPPSAPPAAPPSRMTVQNDLPVFLRYWEHARNESDAQRVQGYRAEVAPSFPEYWEYYVARTADADETVAKRMTELVALDPAFRAAIARIPRDFDAGRTAIAKAFPDFDPDIRVRFVHSLGSFDGGTRVFRGRLYLLFGADLIAQYHSWTDDRAFFTHELFHAYQAQLRGQDNRNAHLTDTIVEDKVARQDPLYVALWEEGLATYVSGWLNPGIAHASLGLDIPEGMEATCLANLPFLVEDLGAKLESTQPSDYFDYMGFRSKDPRRPKRAGYCVGYLVARKLHRRVAMPKLLRLEGAALKREIEATLPAIVNDRE